MPITLDRKAILEKMESELRALLEKGGLSLTEHDETTSLKTLGLEYMDAAEFLINMEGGLGVRFDDDLIDPVMEREKRKNPEACEEGYDHYLTMREIADYVIQKREAA